MVTYHNEGYTNINEAYFRLLRYAEHHSLVLTGYFYEDFLLDDLSIVDVDYVQIEEQEQHESNKKVVVELG